MASLALSSSSTTLRLSSLGFRSLPSISFLRSRRSLARAASPHGRRRPLLVRALTLDFTGSFFEEGGDEEGDGRSSGPSAAAAAAVMEDKEEPQCPPGLRQYESMAVLRPDMTEDERLALIQRYEEVISRFLSVLTFLPLFQVFLCFRTIYSRQLEKNCVGFSIKGFRFWIDQNAS